MKRIFYFLSFGLLSLLLSCQREAEIAPVSPVNTSSSAARAAAEQTGDVEKLLATITVFRGKNRIYRDGNLDTWSVELAQRLATPGYVILPTEISYNTGRRWWEHQATLTVYGPRTASEAWKLLAKDARLVTALANSKYSLIGIGYAERDRPAGDENIRWQGQKLVTKGIWIIKIAGGPMVWD